MLMILGNDGSEVEVQKIESENRTRLRPPPYTGRLFRAFGRGRSFASSYRHSDSGAAGIEFALIVPVFVIILTGLIQFGAIFFLQSNMSNAAREAARSLAVGQISTASQAEAVAAQTLVDWGVNFTVTTTNPDPNDPNDNQYTVEITAPMSDAAIIDYLGIFGGKTISASAAVREET